MSWLHGIYHSMDPYISVDQHCTDESYRPSMSPAPYRISSIYAATLAHSFMTIYDDYTYFNTKTVQTIL